MGTSHMQFNQVQLLSTSPPSLSFSLIYSIHSPAHTNPLDISVLIFSSFLLLSSISHLEQSWDDFHHRVSCSSKQIHIRIAQAFIHVLLCDADAHWPRVLLQKSTPCAKPLRWVLVIHDPWRPFQDTNVVRKIDISRTVHSTSMPCEVEMI